MINHDHLMEISKPKFSTCSVELSTLLEKADLFHDVRPIFLYLFLFLILSASSNIYHKEKVCTPVTLNDKDCLILKGAFIKDDMSKPCSVPSKSPIPRG